MTNYERIKEKALNLPSFQKNLDLYKLNIYISELNRLRLNEVSYRDRKMASFLSLEAPAAHPKAWGCILRATKGHFNEVSRELFQLLIARDL